MPNDFLVKSCLLLSFAAVIACEKPGGAAQQDSVVGAEPPASSATSLMWTDECGALEPYKQALPPDNEINSQPLAERGCKQPTTVAAMYGTADGGGVQILIDVMDSTTIQLPGGGQLHKTNIDAMNAMLKILKSTIQVASLPGASISEEERKKIPVVVQLPNGQEGIVHEDGGWKISSLVNGKYLLKVELIDPLGNVNDTQAAKARLMPVAEKINYSALK